MSPLTRPIPSIRFRAESAHQKDDQADQQNEAEASSANGGPAKVKTAAAEQEKEEDNQ